MNSNAAASGNDRLIEVRPRDEREPVSDPGLPAQQLSHCARASSRLVHKAQGGPRRPLSLGGGFSGRSSSPINPPQECKPLVHRPWCADERMGRLIERQWFALASFQPLLNEADKPLRPHSASVATGYAIPPRITKTAGSPAGCVQGLPAFSPTSFVGRTLGNSS